MRKLVYYIAVTADGFIAGPDGHTDFFPLEGDHMAWLIERYPETIPGHVRGAMGLADTAPRAFDTVLLGRRTHQVAVDAGLASGYPHLRQYVVTHRPADLPDEQGLTASDEDPVTVARRLKAEDSPLDIWLCGGGELAGALVGEIDEIRLKINPVLIGAGRPLISGPVPALPLVVRRRIGFDSGVSYVEYERAHSG
ncbi:deaminase [Dietzia natronolimnaea]|uniref:Deaminase n=1 Tax=Dietzia natronolimnaea TaxID=161920 RepID=A0A2A2WTB3_9ACTN|nr:dihydrofolate reductase family protein [Dietzia natronolimnaea]PAY24224.1 deaminase [Dietzia natronolimnaea]